MNEARKMVRATAVGCSCHPSADFVPSLKEQGDSLKPMSSAPKLKDLQQTDFDRLLSWLDADPEHAGELYEKIRWRLIAILASRGCRVPEELADETIDRVARRLNDIQATYVGDKSLYFLGVMNNVHHEYLKRPRLTELATTPADAMVREQTYVCLDKCIEKLTPHAREIIEQYYAADKRAKINLRKRIAAALGISNSNLRLRALRIRAKLQTCIEHCLEVSETRPSGRVPLC
jgi:DNA-directed RNA polymerase specialized sigma24 family protein